MGFFSPGSGRIQLIDGAGCSHGIAPKSWDCTGTHTVLTTPAVGTTDSVEGQLRRWRHHLAARQQSILHGCMRKRLLLFDLADGTVRALASPHSGLP